MKINLSGVTLIAVSSIEIDATISALSKSYYGIDFDEVKFVTHEKPNNLPKKIKFEKCPRLDNIIKYNRYMFKELWLHVQTSHCLVIQYDSWVLNPSKWDNDWLDYDYIGAPWLVRENSYLTDQDERIRVGNGGFSLRSKKLLEIPNKLGLSLEQRMGYWNEDGNICVYQRDKFLKEGTKYAPIEVAARFSYESLMFENVGIKPFGFHKHLPQELRLRPTLI